MIKTIKDCQKFADAYNQAFDEGKQEFNFKIELKDGRSIDRTFQLKDFKIALNEDKKVNALLKGENRFIEKEGAPYCPCKLQHIEDNICPCKDCLDEAAAMGLCHCHMYMKV